MKKLRILLGDDHPLVLNGIKALLEPHYDVVGCVSDGRQLVESATTSQPDLVVADVSMPQMNGLDAAKQIRTLAPETKVVFVSMHADPMYLRRALQVGASGYVLKAGVIEELLDAIHEVTKGRVYVSPGFGVDITSNIAVLADSNSRTADELTDRQREILQLIADGRLSKEIADILGISIKTVDFHRGRIMSRVGAHTVAELMRLAVERGLIATTKQL